MGSIKLDMEVVRAMRGAAGHEVWEVSCQVPTSSVGEATVTCEAGVGPFSRRVDEGAFLVSAEASGSCRTRLLVRLVIPEPDFRLDVRRIVLRCAGAHVQTSVTRTVRNDFMGRYYELICNADADSTYADWARAHAAGQDELISQRRGHAADETLISLVTPVFNTPPDFLRALLDSVEAQTYQAWEHVLVNASPDNDEVSAILAERAGRDGRFRVVTLEENLGIAGNTAAGIAAACGAYIGFVDHDDLIEPDCLHEYAACIHDDSAPDLLYCDEDYVDERGASPRDPIFKPDFSPELLCSNAYMLHLLMVSRRMLDTTERTTFRHEGAQDYDLALRVVDAGGTVRHVPRVLYHWRLHERSTSANIADKPYAQEAGRLAVADHVARLGLSGLVEMGETPSSYEVHLAAPSSRHLVSVIAPLVRPGRRACPSLDPGTGAFGPDVSGREALPVRGFVGQADVDVELVLVCDRSTTLTPDDFSRLGLPDARLVQVDDDTSEVGVLCTGIRAATGDCVLLASTSLAPKGDRDLADMVCRLEIPDVDVVLPRVVAGDGLLVSSGLSVRPDGSVGRLNQDLPAWDGGYLFTARRPHEVQAAPALGVLAKAFLLGGDGIEDAYTSSDAMMADLGLSVRSRGRRCCLLPFVELTCSAMDAAAGAACTTADQELLLRRHGGLVRAGDPFYNANLDPWSDYYRLRRSMSHADRHER
jgi:hypothetical protein